MTFVFGRIAPEGRPLWYVQADTASLDLVMRCRSRGSALFLKQQFAMGIIPSIDVFARVQADLLFASPTTIYMNANGGGLDHLYVVRTVEAEDFPSDCDMVPSDFLFSQWLMGKHWYVKFPDGRDFEWNDVGKWDSRESAVAAVTEYLEKTYGCTIEV
jgi:hypothetical protein